MTKNVKIRLKIEMNRFKNWISPENPFIFYKIEGVFNTLITYN